MAGDDDAPWLKEATPAATQVSRRSLFWTLTIILSLVAIVAVGLVLLMGRKDGGSTQGYMEAEQAPLIEADIGPYKVAPRDPQGLEVAGAGDVIYGAGEGIDQGSVIDESALPEEPIGRPRDLLPPVAAPTLPADMGMGTAQRSAPAAQAAQPQANVPAGTTLSPGLPKTGALPVKPAARPVPETVPPAALPAKTTLIPAKPTIVPAKPAATTATPTAKPAAAKPGTVQLGAFSTREKADAEWTRIAGKAGLSGKSVIAVESKGTTLYRLRASTGDAAATCRKVVAAGGACSPVE